MATTARRLLDDVNEHISGTRTELKFLKELGYEKGKRSVKLTMTRADEDRDDKMMVFELIDPTQPKREVGFSFLLDRASGDGVILPFPYSKYAGLEQEQTAALGEEEM